MESDLLRELLEIKLINDKSEVIGEDMISFNGVKIKTEMDFSELRLQIPLANITIFYRLSYSHFRKEIHTLIQKVINHIGDSAISTHFSWENLKNRSYLLGRLRPEQEFLTDVSYELNQDHLRFIAQQRIEFVSFYIYLNNFRALHIRLHQSLFHNNFHIQSAILKTMVRLIHKELEFNPKLIRKTSGVVL